MCQKEYDAQRGHSSKSGNHLDQHSLRGESPNILEIQKVKLLFKLEEERKEKEYKRELEKKKYMFEFYRESAISLFVILIIAVLLYYAGERIVAPDASQVEKQLAFGIWGTMLGAACGYLFSKRTNMDK